MKKALYILILGLALLTPEKRLDIGKLLPVELVYLGYEDGLVTIKTDGGETGRGIGVAAALDDLEASASGVIYLDTAVHLLVSQDGQVLLRDLAPYLKKDVGVYLADGPVDLQEAAEYLTVHKSPVTLGETGQGTEVPMLSRWEENKK